MKKKITNNIGIKVLSLLVAILTWYIITTVIDPTTSRVIDDIKVDIKNATLLKGQCYNVTENDVISVTIKGRRSLVNKVKVDDIHAEADLGKLSMVFAVPIDLSFSNDDFKDLQIVNGSNKVMKLTLEKEKEASYEITTEIEGEAPDSFYVSKSEITKQKGYETVSIKGPESLLKKVDHVELRIDISDVRGRIEKEQEIFAVDESGDIIDPARQRLKLGFTKVKVIVSPKIKKDVKIEVKVSGKPAEDYGNKAFENDISTVTVAGNESTMAAFDSIPILVDIDGADKDVEKVQRIKELLPASVKLISDDDVVKVKVPIEKLETKKIEFDSKKIEIKNKKNGQEVKFAQDKKISVEIKGLKDKIRSLVIENLIPYIDAKDLEEGKQEVAIKIQPIEDIKVVEEPKIEVEVVEK